MTSLNRIIPLFQRSARTSLHRSASGPTTRIAAHFRAVANFASSNIYKNPPCTLNSFLTSNHNHFYAHQFELATSSFIYESSEMGKASKSGGYYAVQKGRQQGIYRTWAECESATKGFAGAVFKKFPTEAAAKEFVKGNGYAGTSRGGGGGDGHEQDSGYEGGSSSYASQPSRSYHPYAKPGSTSNAATSSELKSAKRKTPPTTESNTVRRPEPIYNVMSSVTKPCAAGKRKTVAYCDGSSIGNGKAHARAGWGVFFDDPSLHHLNESRRLPGPLQTNNRAELMAIIRAIQLCPNDGRELVIMSDSRYSMDAVTKWLPGWKKRGWTTSTGGEVQNRDLIEELERELGQRYPHPKLEYVKGHAGIDGNEIVDRMAKYGASLPESDSRDLSSRSTAPESHLQRVELTVTVQASPGKEMSH
ncbi:related to Ribonuclease H [Ustilago trichophora]|uniref:Ribonuclease H n=1 Tax=Ustilago trichophora TaxID=86804 RepID=A0A5C3E6H4_9BASI|nr:related to Ribonuclease H [Ustilago trichophora]